MKILGIDPGPKESAYVVFSDGPEFSAKTENVNLVYEVIPQEFRPGMVLAIEEMGCFGMAVGREIFQTCVWSGRFVQAFPNKDGIFWITRREVKLHFCNSVRAKDANIRQALIDRFGGKEKAIGNKKSPGPLYGIKADMWSALALCLYAQEVLLNADHLSQSQANTGLFPESPSMPEVR